MKRLMIFLFTILQQLDLVGAAGMYLNLGDTRVPNRGLVNLLSQFAKFKINLVRLG